MDPQLAELIAAFEAQKVVTLSLQAHARAESFWQRPPFANFYGGRTRTTGLGPNSRRDGGRVAVFAITAGTGQVCGYRAPRESGGQEFRTSSSTPAGRRDTRRAPEMVLPGLEPLGGPNHALAHTAAQDVGGVRRERRSNGGRRPNVSERYDENRRLGGGGSGGNNVIRWMLSCDVKNGYYHMTIREDDQRFLQFRWRGVVYQYMGLPMGYSLAPYWFCTLMFA